VVKPKQQYFIDGFNGDFRRFPDGRSYAASIGIIPKQEESADKGKKCPITCRCIPI